MKKSFGVGEAGCASDAQPGLSIVGDVELCDLETGYFIETVSRLKRALSCLRNKTSLDVLLFSKRPEYFCAEDLIEGPNSTIKSIQFVSDERELLALKRTFDLAIICTHIKGEHKAQVIIRGRKFAPVLVAWTWDNHIDPYSNLRFSALSDIILPTHKYCADLLKTPHAVVGENFPHCTCQWSRPLAAKLLEASISNSRSDSLYGGYVSWPIGQRNTLLRSLKGELPLNAITLIGPATRESYFRMSSEDKFKQWASYKVSVAIPLMNDLSMRVFDALIAGQVPLVPESCYDLDAVIPAEIQASLPIIRFEEMSVSAIAKAWHTAVRRYDELGTEGVYKRHAFARDYHHISVRLGQIARYVLKLADDVSRITVVIDEEGVGLLSF